MQNEIMQASEVTFTTEQVALIQRTICAGATSDELALFVGQCKRTRLDPFTRQIYFIKSGGRMMIQISVDGFRVIAERSGDYAGQDEPKYEEKDGKIVKCSVAVYRWRGDTRYQAAVGVAYMNEYAKGSGTWTQLPHTMLAKVAECIALRKAFPNDLSGLYAPEEMDQAKTVTVEAEVKSADVSPWAAKLDAVKSMDELKSIWSLMPAEAKSVYGYLKDEMKAKLEAMPIAEPKPLQSETVSSPDNSEPTADDIADSLPSDMGGPDDAGAKGAAIMADARAKSAAKKTA